MADLPPPPGSGDLLAEVDYLLNEIEFVLDDAEIMKSVAAEARIHLTAYRRCLATALDMAAEGRSDREPQR